MIPKASQRGGGRDLATHLLNEFDNEYVEVAEVRGAIADDLHGAFAEWEVLAVNLTRCRNYLYSMSVNPDPDGGPLAREQYLDYVQRAEKALGLEGQPRAVIFHIKEGREHCHVVWSRIDARQEKAVHIAFDREKLLMVTRAFAREHGLSLPDGYGPDRSDKRREKVTLYDRAQERATGLTKDERKLMVTQAWQQSDSPRAFVRALEEMGYVLATGDRPYVLVDIYGGMNALTRLIDDRSVKTKDVRAFLEKEFPPDSLPSVEEAKALVAEHRKAREQFAKARDDGQRKDQLARAQAARREQVLAEQAVMKERQRQEMEVLSRAQLAVRQQMRAEFRAEMARVRRQREDARPTGLAAFLGRVTGMNLVVARVQRYRDVRRYLAFRERKQDVAHSQMVERAALKHRHDLQGVEVARKLSGLDAVDARERKALDEKRVREQRTKERSGHQHMPAINLELKPGRRRASVRKSKNRYQDALREREERQRAEAPEQREERVLREEMERAEAMLAPPVETDIELRAEFTKAADEGRSEEESSGGGDESGPRITRATRSSERGQDQSRRRGDFDRER